RHDTADSDSLGGDVVLSITETRDGSLWIGTQKGLDRLRKAPGAERPTIERTKQPSQPVDNGVLAALEDHGGRLWLSTDDGLVRLNRDGNGSHRYRIGEGLQGLDFHPGSALELDDGRLLFGGANGINLLPADWAEEADFDPPVALVSAFAGNARDATQPLLQPDMLSFSQSDGVLHLAFAGLDYGRAGQLRYRYRLEGIDKGWVGPDTLGMAT